MTNLHNIQIYSKEFENIQLLLKYYSEQLYNDFFFPLQNETDENAFKRGEGIYDKFDTNLNNIELILQKEEVIKDFFIKCKENKHFLIKHKNELITQLLRIKKKYVSKEEFQNIKQEWNRQRNETSDEKNRRETEKMLEEITEQKNHIEFLVKQLQKEKQDLQDEFKGKCIYETDVFKSIDKYHSIKHQSESIGISSHHLLQLEEWTKKIIWRNSF